MNEPQELRRYHSPGTSVGAFVIEEEIGRGGMGVVYRAHRPDTGQVVALKLMLPELSGSPRFRERFVREAELMPKLDHPNIVPVFETGEADGELFIAMRLVDGLDLKKLIETEGPLTPKRLVAIARQVASALDAAHETGVVHRDVKPQNILVTTDESGKDLVYVTDFGLVKPAGSESTASRTGQILGSIQYMSPEQVEGMATDGRSDVYSLGCVLFECLTGQIPFDRPNEVAVLWAHVHEEPPRGTDLNRSLPGGLDIVLANALAKHPDDRYLTCGELVDAVEEGMTRTRRPIVMPHVRPLVARIPRSKTEREVWAPNYFPELSRVRRLTMRGDRTKLVAVVSAVALLLGLLQMTYEGGIPQAAADAAGAMSDVAGEITEAAGLSETGGGKIVVGSHRDERSQSAGKTNGERRQGGGASAGILPSIAPAGGRVSTGDDSGARASRGIVFTSTRDGSFDIWSASRNGRDQRQLTVGPEADVHPELSPDGNWVVFTRYVGTSTPDLGGCYAIVMGNCIDDRSHIYLMRRNGSNVTPLTSGNVGDGEPTWSPDGQAIVFTRRLPGRNPDLYAITMDASGQWGAPRQGTDDPGGEMSPDLSPNGRAIVYAAFNDDETEYDSRENHTTHIRVMWLATQDVERFFHDGGASSPTWSLDGSHVYFAGSNGIYYKGLTFNEGPGDRGIQTGFANVKRLTRGEDERPTWSPNGTIAFERCEFFEKCRVMVWKRGPKPRVLIDDKGDYDGMVSWGPAR